MSDATLLARAYAFAAARHADQRRKGESREPYLNHLCEVAEIVALATGGSDANLIAAAVLHDAIEDTGTTHGEIAASFNADVASLVTEVTDDKSLPKAERKRLQVATAAKKSARAKAIKLADATSNLRAIAKSPPADWTVERRREYVAWARAVAEGLRGTNPALDALFDAAAAHAEAALAEPSAR